MSASAELPPSLDAAWAWAAGAAGRAADAGAAEAAAGVAAALALWWVWSHRARLPEGSPTSNTDQFLPFFGHLFAFWSSFDRMYDELVRRTLEIGRDGKEGNRRCWATAIPFAPPFVHLTSPECVEHFMRSPNYEKGPALAAVFGEVGGRGIFNVDGEEWRRQRKTASTMFSHRIVRQDMYPIFVENGEVLAGVLRAAGAGGAPVDMQDYFLRYTMDSIGLVAFGDRLDTMRRADGGVRFTRAFDAAQAVVKQRFVKPWWRLQRLLGLGEEGRMAGYVRAIDEQAMRIVQHRRLVPDDVLRRHPDLLSRFIERRRAEGVEFTDREARDVCVSFILAGRDTTGALLAWTLFELATRPAVLARVLDELREAGVTGAPGEEPPPYEAMQRLEYLEAVLYETLRLHPSVPIDGKYAVRDDVLPDGTRVPRGAMVSFSPYILGRLPELWDDPERFDPARFLGPKPTPFVYPAFNAGPRICLGKHVALLECKALFSVLLPRFRFELAVPRETVAYAISIVLPVKGGLPMRVRPRERSGPGAAEFDAAAADAPAAAASPTPADDAAATVRIGVRA